ncbi:MAG: triphosphoribosyl-dephospho-CoA synthase MdcB [Burkholderiales bacterium]
MQAYASHAIDRAPQAWSAARVGRLAVRALFDEALLGCKPGLVGPGDSGAHGDMSLATFYRSIASLRSYFPAIAALGAAGAPWSALRGHGLDAEAAMLRATGGVNTHRGAIFHLGLLCAAAGALAARGNAPRPVVVCAYVRGAYGRSVLGPRTEPSHGSAVEARYGAGGARQEAARGYPSVRGASLPAFREALARTQDRERASLQALFTLVAQVRDTNLMWRGGAGGLAFAQGEAQRFLDRGGVLARDWRETAASVHRAFVARRLSPGGCADLLAVTLFLHDLERA